LSEDATATHYTLNIDDSSHLTAIRMRKDIYHRWQVTGVAGRFVSPNMRDEISGFLVDLAYVSPVPGNALRDTLINVAVRVRAIRWHAVKLCSCLEMMRL